MGSMVVIKANAMRACVDLILQCQTELVDQA